MKTSDVDRYYGKGNFEQLFMLLIQEKMNEIKEKMKQDNELMLYNKDEYYPSTSTEKGEVDEKNE